MDSKKVIIGGMCFILFGVVGFGLITLLRNNGEEPLRQDSSPVISFVDRGVIESYSKNETIGDTVWQVTYNVTRKDRYEGDKLTDSVLDTIAVNKIAMEKPDSNHMVKPDPPKPGPLNPDPSKPAVPKYTNAQFKKMILDGVAPTDVKIVTSSRGLDENEARPTSAESVLDKIRIDKWSDFTVVLTNDSATGRPIRATIYAIK